jgi:hypothetical protein
VLGKKILKPAEDEETVATRQGVSFEAFKIPEVPEGDESVDDGEEPVVRPPPVPVPLLIDNVMRDPRVKFFGIPKLGAFVAVPFSFHSIDHEYGCVPKSNNHTSSARYSFRAVTTPDN